MDTVNTLPRCWETEKCKDGLGAGSAEPASVLPELVPLGLGWHSVGELAFLQGSEFTDPCFPPGTQALAQMAVGHETDLP